MPLEKLFLTISLIIVFSSSAYTKERKLVLDDGCCTQRWQFIPGREFPGASGEIRNVTSRNNHSATAIDYDFTNGGEYISGKWCGTIPEKVKSFTFELSSKNKCFLLFRILDSTGRTFNAISKEIPSCKNKHFTYKLDSEWKNYWGGTSNSDQPTLPLKAVYIGINKNTKALLNGTILIHKVTAKVAENENTTPGYTTNGLLTGQCSGWQFTGSWCGGWKSPVYRVSAIPGPAAVNATMSFSMPNNVRSSTKTYHLSPMATETVIHPFFINNNINPHQQYRIKVSFKSNENEYNTYVTISGEKADLDLLGTPKTSKAINTSIFGTCTHFSYGHFDAFKNWKQNRKLITLASHAGLKWLRDHVGFDNNAPGKAYKVRQYDIDWLNFAKSNGLDVIICIRMYAKETPEQFAAKAVAIVRQTKHLVKVFELGNEPENFGKWKETFGGTWNGKEKDGSTSPWVKAHLLNTNHAADAIKADYPDIKLIALGACPPTNFRSLELGLSKNIDGIVDHAYSFALPAERLPWSTGLKERDGREVGDAKGSFRGLIESYYKKFSATGIPRSLWVTEFGWPNYIFNGKNEKKLYAAYSEKAQAAYILRRQLLSLTMPIKVSCQFNLMDNYNSRPFDPEGNFGLVRSDLSKKPAYHAVQKLCHSFADYRFDSDIAVVVTSAPLHKAVRSKNLLKWDGHDIVANNDIEAYAYSSSKRSDSFQIAVWSAQPFGAEFSKRCVALKITGMGKYCGQPVCYDLMTGDSYDIDLEVKDNALVLPKLMVDTSPLVIRFYKEES